MWPVYDLAETIENNLGRVERYNPGFSGATLSGCELDSAGGVILSTGATSGTVTEDIAVASLAEWYKYFRQVTTPANTSVSCAIKDTANNVLVASMADGDILSTIDSKTYKTIRLVHTLTRVSTSDTTPELHYREVEWLGHEQELNYTLIGCKNVNASTLETVLTVNGKGKLFNIDSLSNGSYPIAYLEVHIDGALYFSLLANSLITPRLTFEKKFKTTLVIKMQTQTNVSASCIYVTYGAE